MNNRGSIGLVCLLITTLLLLLCQSLYAMLAADYQYIKSYVRQRQVVYAVTSGIQVLERLSAGSSTDLSLNLLENLPPDELLHIDLNTYQQNGVQWLVAKGSIAEMEIVMVQGLFTLPDNKSNLYNYCLVSNIFNIDPTASVEAAGICNYQSQGNGSFVNWDIAAYARYAFLPPDKDGWQAGLGKNVFADPSGASLSLPANRSLRGSAVFTSYGDITIGAGSSYPDGMQFIANGNIIVESNVRLDKVFILAGNSVKISRGSLVTGKVFARRGIVIESKAQVKDVPAANLRLSTDKYLW